MSSTASPPEPAPAPGGTEAPYRSGFNAALRGLQVSCDGGGPIAGTHLAGRQNFAGTLSGDYRDFGPDRPHAWRWYLLTALTQKPDGYAHQAVWCEAESLDAPGSDDARLREHLYTTG